MQNLASMIANAASNCKGAAKLAAAMIVLHCLCAVSGAPIAKANHQSPYPAPAPEPQPSGVKIVRRAEPLAFRSTLVVRNPIGSIEMRGWDREQLYVQASTKGESEYAPILEINKTATGAEVIVKDISRRRFLGLLPPKVAGCDLVISLPRRALADVKTINGAIAASALDGSLKCETINGRIQIERVLGRVEAKTMSGAITITRLAPSTWALRQGSGLGPNPQDRPQARPPGAAFEGLIAQSTNGGIALEDVIGDVGVSTIHGKIEAKHIRVRGGETFFETISGDLEVELLVGASDVIAKSMAGKIDLQVPNYKIIEETKTQAVIRTPARPGQMQTVTLKTVSGKITVR